MKRFLMQSIWALPVFSVEAGGAPGGEDPGAGDPPAGDPPADPGAWQAPDFVPESFRGATAEETLQKLSTGYGEVETRANGLRDKLAKLPAAPKAPEDYTYEPSEALAPVFGDLSDNPAFNQAKVAMHKHGVSQEQFAGIIEDIYGPLQEQGLLAPAYNPKTEVDAFIKATGLDEKDGAAALTESATFAEGLFSQLKGVPEALGDDVKATLMSLTDTAAGNVLLRALSGRLNENGIRVSGEGGQGGAMTADEVRRMANDPRIDPANRDVPDPARRYDPALRERYDEAHKRLSRATK